MFCNGIIHLHDLKPHFYHRYFDDFESGYKQCCKGMNKKFEIHDKRMKVAKRTENQVLQEKVKDKANLVATKKTSQNKAKGKVDDEKLQRSGEIIMWSFTSPDPSGQPYYSHSSLKSVSTI